MDLYQWEAWLMCWVPQHCSIKQQTIKLQSMVQKSGDQKPVEVTVFDIPIFYGSRVLPPSNPVWPSLGISGWHQTRWVVRLASLPWHLGEFLALTAWPLRGADLVSLDLLEFLGWVEIWWFTNYENGKNGTWINDDMILDSSSIEDMYLHTIIMYIDDMELIW